MITVEEALALGLRSDFLLSFIHRLELLVDAQCIRLARGLMLPVALVSTLAHTVARLVQITKSHYLSAVCQGGNVPPNYRRFTARLSRA